MRYHNSFYSTNLQLIICGDINYLVENSNSNRILLNVVKELKSIAVIDCEFR